MRVGIVQPLVGHIGGNDKVLENLFKVFKDDTIELFTFSKVSKTVPYNVKVHTKIPKHIPFLGVYQKLLMPQHNYSRCDVVISTVGYSVKTDKPLIIYDQNHMANDFNREVPLKYQKGFWKWYYKPYQLLNKIKPIQNARYISVSRYSAKAMMDATGIIADVVYPCVDTSEFYSNEKKEQVCVVGRISPEKNLKNTVEILNQVNYPCIIFGNCTKTNEAYLNRLKEIACNNIKFVINQPRSELLELMADSKVMFTSSLETFGITTVEGIASGCVPVVPNKSAHPEVVPVLGCRYNNKAEAINHIEEIMVESNKLKMDILSAHIKDFDFENFKRNILNTVKSVVQ